MLIAIAGLIGAGKSTLTQALEGVKFFEPVEDNPYLSDYYHDPARWCFPMQMHLLYKRWEMVQAAFWANKTGQDAILDRSIYEDWAFASLGFKSGYMSEREFETYCHTYELVTSYHDVPMPDLVIYLQAPIETLLNHITQRDRACERGMMADYLRNLNSEYEKLLTSLEKKAKVVYLDATQPAVVVAEQAKKAIADRKKELDNATAPRYRGGI